MVDSVFLSGIKLGIKNSFNFSGRANRSEFWWYILFLGGIYSLVPKGFEFIGNYINTHDYNSRSEVISTILMLLFLILLSISFLITHLSVVVRRLHDLNLRGWYYFIIVIPIIGLIMCIYWGCKEGGVATNRFGNPRESIGEITLIDILLVAAIFLICTPSHYLYSLVH